MQTPRPTWLIDIINISSMFKETKTQPSDEARLNSTEKFRDKVMDLEGECKIQKISPLQFSCIKAIPLTLLAVVSVVGILFLVWYRRLRLMLWFRECELKEATYLFVEDNLTNSSIEPITISEGQQFFEFKKLKYTLNQAGFTPVAYDYESNFAYLSSEINLKMGLDTATVERRRQQFGVNVHPVQIPNYFVYLIDVLLEPFFLLQYIVVIAYFAEGYVQFGILNIAFSVITTTINYIMTYISYKKIKDMAERKIKVRVLRNSKFTEVDSDELVPGDLVDFDAEIMCDCILLSESMFVNEASLTGESIPIGKFAASNLDQAQDGSRWLNEGSTIVEKRHQALAAVVYTGYTTRRGRIIRRILARTQQYPMIFSRALIFLVQAFIVAMVIYFATLSFVMSKDVSNLIIGMRFVDFLGFSFPPTFPIFFNVAYSFALARLKQNNVLCTEPEKTVESCNLKTLCFDKTGTLTENKVEVKQVLKFQDKSKIVDITSQINDSIDQNDIVWQIFATCHSVKENGGSLLGDEVDLRMFLFSNYALANQESACFRVAKKGGKEQLVVLRINQFQSRFQSMSVLVRNQAKKQYYIFVKGAPQKIHKESIVKIEGLDKTIESLSLEGLRTICFGHKRINDNEVKHFLECKREEFEREFSILGLVAFENKLKQETYELLSRLAQAEINTKMITGDNIYIAVETAIRAGIIPDQSTVLLIEGHKQKAYEQNVEESSRVFQATALKRHGGQIQKEMIQLKESMMHLVDNFPIAVDNAFLKLEPQPLITSSMKVFARISPEGKALIVNQLRKTSHLEHSQKPLLSRYCGKLPNKVGMCGDGANDLIAIRSADVGIGINNSDASYAATFSVANLLDIDYIIRDGKTTTANIVSMILYYEFISFLKITATLLLMMDTANMNEKMFMYLSFATTLVFAILLAMSHPSETVTPRVPNGNLLSPANHLRFWGSLVIASAGLVGGFFYYISTPEYVPNEKPVVTTDWYAYTHSGTCMFLLMLPPFAIYALFFYIGSPWNSKIYKNYLLLLLILLNVAATVLLHYITKYCYDAFQMFEISYSVATIMLFISVGACLVGFIYNQTITEFVEYCSDRSRNRNALNRKREGR